ncbi:MAG: DUF547 domain-containing protein [Bacteroidota bacterium]
MTLVLFVCVLGGSIHAQAKEIQRLGQSFLEAALARSDTQPFLDSLSRIEHRILASTLISDSEKIVFWVNVYNGYVIHLLVEDPSRFSKKNKFYKKRWLTIAGHRISLDQIEHQILRGGQWKYGLGKVKSAFRPKWERQLRVTNIDPRIHFVLNCGAMSCPAVDILRQEGLENLLQRKMISYLQEHTIVDESDNVVITTPLMSWFRGDFGGRSGIKDLLKSIYIIPPDMNPKIKWESYDWTMKIPLK